MEKWEQILSNAITKARELPVLLNTDEAAVDKVTTSYPMFINPYYLGLIQKKEDAVYRQAIPDIREVTDGKGFEDPLNEEGLSPVPGLTHKYPDRVLFLVSNRCAMYCRFCNRKRKVGRSIMVTDETIKGGIDYIRSNRKIRDVLLSGGDPLLLSDQKIHHILSKVRSIPHVEIIRIGTRVPCTLPQRVTTQLVLILKQFHPLFINTHFNHPSEITLEASHACSLLADAGIPIGCQTVLLKGVNDDPKIMKELMQKLVRIRVRPYYLFQADLVKGTSHFWTSLKKGLDIMSRLQGHISGLCIPRFMIDLPNGGGKIPISPNYIRGIKKDEMMTINYLGETYPYPLLTT
ncbi:MAG: KamA family radical SAM protein [Deltaproteobacteria bacterium]|nr:KamA family radical SAM protein [Deltaproteobacteria bacterium]